MEHPPGAISPSPVAPPSGPGTGHPAVPSLSVYLLHRAEPWAWNNKSTFTVTEPWWIVFLPAKSLVGRAYRCGPRPPNRS